MENYCFPIQNNKQTLKITKYMENVSYFDLHLFEKKTFKNILDKKNETETARICSFCRKINESWKILVCRSCYTKNQAAKRRHGVKKERQPLRNRFCFVF